MRPLALISRWHRLTEQLGAVAGSTQGLLDTLLAHYTEPHRHYHTEAHIEDVLAGIDWLRSAGEPVREPAEVELAAWFHDAIYEPGAADNESRSAQLAVEALGESGIAPQRLTRVSELVLATEHHVPDGPDAALLVDADLAVLGRDLDAYVVYARAIRAEYGHVADDGYRQGRAAVLQTLLDRPLLYHTRAMSVSRTHRAQENMRAELRMLRATPGEPLDVVLQRVGA